MSRGKWAMMTVAVCVLAAAVAVAYAAGTQAAVPVQEVVKAQRFELVDAEGKARAVLALKDGDPGLVLLDKDGRPRAWLDGGNSVSGPGLRLYDGTSFFARSELTLRGGEPFLLLYGKDERGCAALSLDVVGVLSGFTLPDKDDKLRALMGVEGEMLGLTLQDKDGELRSALVLVDGNPRLLLRDKEGKVIWGAP